jgi:hypothetical protein
VDAFLARGIHPAGVFSLNEESLLWEEPEASIVADPLDLDVLDSLTAYEAQRWGVRSATTRVRKDAGNVAGRLHEYATRHAAALGLEEDQGGAPIQVRGFHTMFRVGDDGQLLTEAGVQFVQTPRAEVKELGGLKPRAGSTVVFSGDGTPRYLISKPLRLGDDGVPEAGDPRMVAMRSFVAASDERDPLQAWAGEASDPATRMTRRFTFALVHQGIPSAKKGGADGR